MKLSGRIVTKDKKSGEKNGREWTCWFFTLEDGNKFSTFDTVTADLLPEENTVEVEVEQKGDYNNIKEVIKSDYIKPKEPTVEDVKMNKSDTPQSKAIIDPTQLRIIRQCCVKAAARIWTNKNIDNNGVLDSAKKFEEWILR